jgi:flavin-binding protein dodecin
MSDHIYKTIELVGSSSKGVEDAVQRAVAKLGFTLED